MKNSNVFVFFLACLLSIGLNAQTLNLITPDMTVKQGDVFDMEVRVENFDTIISLQFAVFWDASVIEFQSVKDYNLPEVDIAANEQNYLMYGHLGKLRFFWFDPDTNFSGVTLDDGTAIFKIQFKAIGSNASTTLVEVASDPDIPPLPLEFVNTSGQEVELDINAGLVTIDGTTSTKESVTQEFTLFQNSPNPFTDLTNISFYLNQSSKAQLSIYDHSGKVVLERVENFARGLHTIQVNRDLFTSAGSYFFTLKTENATATRQLVAQ